MKMEFKWKGERKEDRREQKEKMIAIWGEKEIDNFKEKIKEAEEKKEWEEIVSLIKKSMTKKKWKKGEEKGEEK